MNNEQKAMNTESRTESKRGDVITTKADRLAHCVYAISKRFPKEELYGVTSQIRRASISVPLNLIEGFARQSQNDHRRFLEIAYGSLKETKYLLHFSFKEGLILNDDYRKLLDLAEEVSKMLWSKIQTLKRRGN